MSALSLCGLTVSVDAKYSNPSALALSAVAAAYLGMRLGEISSLLRGALEVFFFGKDVGIEIEHGQLERVVQHLYAMGTARRAATVQQQPRSPPLLFESLDLGVAELGIIYDVQNAFSNNSVI